MKLVSNVIAISLFLSCSAHAGQETGALGALLAQTAGLKTAAVEAPAPEPLIDLQKYQAEKSLASDVLDLRSVVNISAVIACFSGSQSLFPSVEI